jgi:hypothetical protein
MPSSGLLRRVALVRTDVSEEPGPSIIRVTRVDGLGTSLAVTSKRPRYEGIQSTRYALQTTCGALPVPYPVGTGGGEVALLWVKAAGI